LIFLSRGSVSLQLNYQVGSSYCYAAIKEQILNGLISCAICSIAQTFLGFIIAVIINVKAIIGFISTIIAITVITKARMTMIRLPATINGLPHQQLSSSE
jgi:hypothetical protein